MGPSFTQPVPGSLCCSCNLCPHTCAPSSVPDSLCDPRRASYLSEFVSLCTSRAVLESGRANLHQLCAAIAQGAPSTRGSTSVCLLDVRVKEQMSPSSTALWELILHPGGLDQGILTSRGSKAQPLLGLQPLHPIPHQTPSEGLGPGVYFKPCPGAAWWAAGPQVQQDWPDLTLVTGPQPRLLPTLSLLLQASGSLLVYLGDSRVYVERGGWVCSPGSWDLRIKEISFSVFIFHILDFESQAGVDIYLGRASPSPWASLM